MLRILFQYLLPLLLPFLLYLSYVALSRGRTPGWLADAPWAALTAAGVALMVVGLVTWTLTTGGDPGERYVPARIEDGRVIPGTTVDP